jgi:Uncharacterized protein conserved in bacteria (DUF2188)
MTNPANNIHTQPSTTGWENQQNGIVLSRHFKKNTAVAKGRKLAKHLATDLTIHGRDGSVLLTAKYTTPISVAAK